MKAILILFCSSFSVAPENTRLWLVDGTKNDLLDVSKTPAGLNLKDNDKIQLDTKSAQGKWTLSTPEESKSLISNIVSSLATRGSNNPPNPGRQQPAVNWAGGNFNWTNPPGSVNQGPAGNFGGGFGNVGGGFGGFGGGFGGFGGVQAGGNEADLQEAIKISRMQAEQDRGKYEKLENQLVGRGLKLHIVSDDGNCLFRAVAYQVNGSDQSHAEVRAAVTTYMLTNREHFEPFVVDMDYESYIMTMSCDAEYGTNLEVQAIFEIYGRPVEVYSDEAGAEPLNIFQGTHFIPNPIRLSYHRGNHYNAVEPITSEEFVIPPVQFGAFAKQ